MLDGRDEPRRAGGPGTCTFMSTTGKKFFADAEWTLTPETLWLYDINDMDGVRFIGRKDRTHNRLYRSRPYRCEVRDAGGRRQTQSYDRGGTGEVKTADGRALQWTLLRAHYPAADGAGLDRVFSSVSFNLSGQFAENLRLTGKLAGRHLIGHQVQQPPQKRQSSLCKGRCGANRL